MKRLLLTIGIMGLISGVITLYIWLALTWRWAPVLIGVLVLFWFSWTLAGCIDLPASNPKNQKGGDVK